MAISWKQAQEREIEFWNGIYVRKNKDIRSYSQITDETALLFCTKTLARFNLNISDLREQVVADVGCGPYGLLRGIDVNSKSHNHGPSKIIGIDPLMDYYKEFNTLPSGRNIELVTSKGESIPLDDFSCDLVFSINVVDHVENPELFMKECQRIMKKNGRTFISVHVVRPPFTILGRILFLIDKNHPHHFSEAKFMKSVSKIFSHTKLTNRISIIEDQPEFTFINIFRNVSKIRGIKRWLSTFLLRSIYIECENKHQ